MVSVAMKLLWISLLDHASYIQVSLLSELGFGNIYKEKVPNMKMQEIFDGDFSMA